MRKLLYRVTTNNKVQDVCSFKQHDSFFKDSVDLVTLVINDFPTYFLQDFHHLPLDSISVNLLFSDRSQTAVTFNQV